VNTAGTAAVVRFNWPKYALVGVVVIAAVAAGPVVPPAAAAGVAATAALSVVSLAATWWVYDHRRVYDLIADSPPGGPWVAVHAGFDEATPRLARRLGRPAAVIALRHAGGASIDRAAHLRPAAGLPAEPGHLPLATGRAARVHLSFSAHEVRDPDATRALFAELARALRAGGRLVVTEHVVDPATVAVYGPGALHFRTRRHWLAVAAAAGLAPVAEDRLTPFVRRFTWERC
jgi:SAM-dependent methyltransferase